MSLVSVCTAILNKVKKYDCILHAQDVYIRYQYVCICICWVCCNGVGLHSGLAALDGRIENCVSVCVSMYLNVCVCVLSLIHI